MLGLTGRGRPVLLLEQGSLIGPAGKHTNLS